MQKIKKIEEFLNLIKEISKNNIEVDSNLVYANLIKLNTPKEIINGYFPEWVNRYKSNEHIDVFVADDWKYFCQFVSKKQITSGYKMVKMYIPLDKEHIYEGANKIFDYLSDNDIPHVSKIGSHTRFDDIVVRLSNISDAEKLRMFVNNNPYIKEGLIKTNPFAFSDENVSLTWDGHLSYNSTVSDYISDYINYKKETNTLDEVSYSDFYMYIYKNYGDIFGKGDNIISFMRDKKLDNSEALYNYEQVTRLLLKALRPESNIGTLYNETNDILNKNIEISEKERLNILIRRGRNRSDNKLDINMKENFDYIFLKMSTLEDAKTTVDRMRNFIMTGEYRFFTRADGIRDNIIANNITPKEMQLLLLEKQKDAFIESSINTFTKYGSDQLLYAIKYAKTNNYQGFTCENNSRKNVMNFVKPNEFDLLMVRILENAGYTINNTDEAILLYNEYINSMCKSKSK